MTIKAERLPLRLRLPLSFKFWLIIQRSRRLGDFIAQPFSVEMSDELALNRMVLDPEDDVENED